MGELFFLIPCAQVDDTPLLLLRKSAVLCERRQNHQPLENGARRYMKLIIGNITLC